MGEKGGGQIINLSREDGEQLLDINSQEKKNLHHCNHWIFDILLYFINCMLTSTIIVYV